MDIIPEKKISFAFNIPDNTIIEEGIIRIPGTGIIGNHASVIPGVKASVLIIGEGVSIEGPVETAQDLRADVWCRFKNDVTVNGNACIGEFTAVDGKVFVQGDLDIGKEVKLNGGFETRGWVVVRNPLPIMIYLFMYIRALVGIGKTSEEIDRALEELFDDGDEIYPEDLSGIDLTSLPGFENMFLLPIGSKISETAVSVPEEAKIGKDCRIVSDIYASNFFSGAGTEIVGLIRSKGDVRLAENGTVRGDIQAGGQVIIGRDGYISGDVRAKTVCLHESVVVDGKILAPGGVSIMTDEKMAERMHLPETARKETAASQKTEKPKRPKKEKDEKTESSKKAKGEPILWEVEAASETAAEKTSTIRTAEAEKQFRRKRRRRQKKR